MPGSQCRHPSHKTPTQHCLREREELMVILLSTWLQALELGIVAEFHCTYSPASVMAITLQLEWMAISYFFRCSRSGLPWLIWNRTVLSNRGLWFGHQRTFVTSGCLYKTQIVTRLCLDFCNVNIRNRTMLSNRGYWFYPLKTTTFSWFPSRSLSITKIWTHATENILNPNRAHQYFAMMTLL